MPAYHVFVDGPVEAAPDAVERLAEAMAERYGLPASELSLRLARGRFRVKANVDRATAESYVGDLEALGARVSVEDAVTGASAIAPAGTAASTAASAAAGRAAGAAAVDGGYRAGRATSDPIPRTNVRASQEIPTGRTSQSMRTITPAAGTPSARTSQPLRTTPAAGTPTSPSLRTTPAVGTPATTSQALRTPAAGASPLPDAPSRPSNPSGLAAAAVPSSHASAAIDAPSRPSNPSGLAAAAAVVPSTRASAPASGLAAAGAAATASARTATPPSGLSAAFSGEIPLDLGALGDGQELALAGVDGEATASTGVASFAPPGASDDEVNVALDDDGDGAGAGAGDGYDVDDIALPASIGPALRPTPAPTTTTTASTSASAATAAAATSPKSASPVDLFAPPEASTEVPLDFAIADELPRARPSSPPATVATASSQRLPVTPVPTGATATTTSAARREMPRGRFIAGVVLAIVLGLVPAHLVGAMQERAAYGAIDRKVQQYQADPTVSEAEVESFRAGQLAAKQGKRTTIALTSMLLWAAVSAAAAYVWFRRIPWDAPKP